VVVAVWKKYSDDRGGSLAALITFYGFLAVFPLLLLFITVVGIVLGNNMHAQEEIVNSALSEFPVIGDRLGASIRALHRATPLAFAVSFVGLLWGSLGVTNHIQRASETMWAVPRHQEANTIKRVLRSLLLLGTIAAAVVGSTVLTGISTIGGGKLSTYPAAYWTYSLIGAGAVNLGAYLVAFHILAPAGTALETVGGVLVSHALRHTTELYGFFATVLGLVFWLSLGSQLFVYAGEANVVLARHLWPRHLDDPPPGTEGAAQATEGGTPAQASANS